MADDHKNQLVAEIARASSVAESDVRKVLDALGIDNHLDEAARHIGAAPSMKNILLGFHISESGILV